MHSIIVLNTKGGCGKTTLATNLASYHVRQGHSVMLADFDPQGSSSEWLAARSHGHRPDQRWPLVEHDRLVPRDHTVGVMASRLAEVGVEREQHDPLRASE